MRIRIQTLAVSLALAGSGHAAKFIPLPMLPGDQGGYAGEALGVSGDGRVVVGASDAANANGAWQAYRWTRGGGTQALGNLPGASGYSFANGVSRDGATIVGTSQNSAGNFEGFRWTAGNGMQGAGVPPGYTNSRVYSISDAGVFVGDTNTSASRRAFVHTSAAAVFTEAERAYDISSNGAIVTGNVYESLQSTLTQAYRFTVANGAFEVLDPTNVSRSHGLAVSDDGGVIVGWQQTRDVFGSLNPRQAYRWTPSGVELLGYYSGLAAGTTEARGVSGDGAHIVGLATGVNPTTSQFESNAIVWDAAGGMRTIADELAPHVGSALNGWKLAEATAISSDGRTVVGNGRLNGGESTPWLAYLPGPLHWNTGSGDWGVAGNWDQNFSPSVYDDVVIAPATSSVVTTPVGFHEFDTLTVGVAGLGSATLDVGVGRTLRGYSTTVIGPTGRINLNGGLLDVGRTDNHGVVAGGGALANGGFHNNPGGVLQVAAGESLAVGGQMFQNGNFSVASGATATFAPAAGYFGNGATGGGELIFQSYVQPGDLVAGQAAVTFDNDVTLAGSASGFGVFLNGTTPDTQHTQINVTGDLTLAGSLTVSLGFSYTPVLGDSFDILNWGTLTGQFSSVFLPHLNNLSWDTSQLYSTGILRIAAASLDGDFNSDGFVTNQDYRISPPQRSRKGTPTAMAKSTPPTTQSGAIRAPAVVADRPPAFPNLSR